MKKLIENFLVLLFVSFSFAATAQLSSLEEYYPRLEEVTITTDYGFTVYPVKFDRQDHESNGEWYRYATVGESPIPVNAVVVYSNKLHKLHLVTPSRRLNFLFKGFTWVEEGKIAQLRLKKRRDRKAVTITLHFADPAPSYEQLLTTKRWTLKEQWAKCSNATGTFTQQGNQFIFQDINVMCREVNSLVVTKDGDNWTVELNGTTYTAKETINVYDEKSKALEFDRYWLLF